MSGDNSAKPKVAIALPEDSLRKRLLDLLQSADVEVESLSRDGSLWESLKGHDADVVVIRHSQIPPGGRAVIDAMTESGETPDIVILGENESPAERAGLLAAGATHVVSENASNQEIGETLESLAIVAAVGGLNGPEGGGNPAEPHLADFISRSPLMKQLNETVKQVAEADSSLLITGETGVGKERLARAIHAESRRSTGPFVFVNCGALSESLLESELFGHQRGAFTGAHEERRGQFELAEGGTVFLDEIGDMPKSLQVKLLAVLQRREIQRLGSERVRRVNVRVMAATNCDLRVEVANQRFRADLYYRLNVVPLEIPPLRERREDIPDLVGSFINHFRQLLGKSSVEDISPDALQVLLRYDFPGNVRELANIIERAVLLCRGKTVNLSDLAPELLGQATESEASNSNRVSLPLTGGAPLPDDWLGRPLSEARQTFIDIFEEAYLRGLLQQTKGVVGKTAKLAGITSRSLYDKMKRHGLRKEEFRTGEDKETPRISPRSAQ